MAALRMASCMAPNADALCRSLAAWLAGRLGVRVKLVEQVDWRERERMLDAGEIDLCWICGLPYVEKADSGAGVTLGVAPVMRAPRYGGLPVYFSDIVVRSDSRYSCFSDLAGEAFAYNEPRSHSGYNVVGHHLAHHGRTFDFFGTMVEAGSHQQALRQILSGRVAGAAIDSTVLEAEVRSNPSLAHSVRRIGTLGPSPAPPWVFSAGVAPALRADAERCLATMHEDPAGAEILAGWGIVELRRVSDADYDPIRRMARIAARAIS